MEAFHRFVIYFLFYSLSSTTDSLLAGYHCTFEILYFLQTDDYSVEIYTSWEKKRASL
jgi:hypothetical protein